MKFTLLTIATACLILPKSIHGISDEGLVQLFDFGSEVSYPRSGDNVYDLSGNNNNGTIIRGENGPIFDVNVGSNGAMKFAGSLGYINANLDKSANISFTCWATINSKEEQMMFQAGYNAKDIDGPRDYAGPNLWLTDQKGIWNKWDGQNNSFGELPFGNDNKFHQYVIAQESGGTAKLYLDGVFKGTGGYRDVTGNNILAVGGPGSIPPATMSLPSGTRIPRGVNLRRAGGSCTGTSQILCTINKTLKKNNGSSSIVLYGDDCGIELRPVSWSNAGFRFIFTTSESLANVNACFTPGVLLTEFPALNPPQAFPFNGAIQRWSVHNRALSAEEVLEDFLSGPDDQYLVMGENTNWCVAMYNRMTEEECSAYAQYRGLTDGGTMNGDNAPKGCYLDVTDLDDKQVHFNQHENGSSSSYRKPVCTALQLRAEFALPPPNCTTSESAIGIITCAFTGIVCPGNATQSMSILDYDCEGDYNATNFGNTSVTENTTSITCDPNVSEFNAIAKVDYTSGHDGDVNFCIRTDLKEANEIMYYRSQRVNMTFSYEGGFSVTSFNTTEYEGMRKAATIATKSFGVMAEICDSGGNTLTDPSALSIGDNLFVCIKTKDEGTKITAITDFTAEKVKDTDTDTAEKLVIDESLSNVVVTGLGSEKLMVVINFPARFFTNKNAIMLKGDVEVKGTKNRRLSSSRALQEATSDVSSKDATFGLVIDVVAETSSATGHGMMVAAFLGVPTLLLV